MWLRLDSNPITGRVPQTFEPKARKSGPGRFAYKVSKYVVEAGLEPNNRASPSDFRAKGEKVRPGEICSQSEQIWFRLDSKPSKSLPYSVFELTLGRRAG
jgi:hypothetical protein